MQVSQKSRLRRQKTSDRLGDRRSRNLATNLIRCGTKFLLHDFTTEMLKYIDTLIVRILEIFQ